jgi:hypothetical protein
MSMNKRLETAVILILLLILVGIGVSSCAKTNTERETNPTSNILIYDGTIGKILGCMFAPGECDKMKKDNKAHDSSDMTEEFEKLDEQMEKENK